MGSKLSARTLAIVIGPIAGLSAWRAEAQSPQGVTPSVTPLAFEVASVKPIAPPIPSGGGPWIVTHGRFRAETGYVRGMIGWAYNVLAAQVKGGPDWIDREPYYVDARAGDPDAGPDQIRLMLQTLLTDRFKLIAHRGTQQGQIYTLTVGKNGQKLQDAKEGQKNYINWTGPGQVTFTENTTLLGLVNILSSLLGSPVLDETGLKGSYSFSLEFTDPRDPRPRQTDSTPDLFAAIQEQLGLRLQATKGAVEVLVIDRMERPSAAAMAPDGKIEGLLLRPSPEQPSPTVVQNAQPNTQVGASSPTCVEEATARSPNVATQTVDIRITNQRSNASNIYWLNQQGQRVFYRTLDSGAFYTQPTYSEHPWVATDDDEHCTMFFVATTAPHQEVTIRSPDGKIASRISRIRVEANVQAPNLIGKSHPYTKFGPDQWPKDELNHYIAMQNGLDSEARKRIEPERSAVASKAMIAGTSEPLAIHAGLDVLRHGGNAADAALTTSLAQIALTAGAAVSYAGIMTVVYYDAATGKVHTLNASYNTVQNEKDPLSIPGIGEHSGRTVLVPGYMAGVQALHDRFGRLPFSMLFGPAIWIAENGVVVSPTVNAWISSQKTFVTRLPETKRIFTKPDGELYKTGDLFRQLELAATLKKIAAQGSTYIYKGEWAHHFVDIAQREGGKITLKDLAAYRPLWTEPLQASYADYQVVLLGPPNTGGFITLGGLGLAEVAGLKKSGHYTTSAEALYNLIQIERTTQAFASASPSTRQEWFPEVEPSLESLLTRKAAERFWAGIQRKMVPPPAKDPSPHHSAGIVAVDEQGNVACILHSINAILWGATGIFVDGISIPDSAVFQQRAILDAGPGMRLPESTNPLIVLKGGKPVLASVAIGSGLLNVTLENLINILDFGMDPQTAVNQPNTQGPFRGVMANAPGKPEYEKEAIGQGDFLQSVIDGVVARGQAIKLVDKYAQPGYWIGIQVDPLTHKLRGAGTPLLPALVEGY